jgi:hypothetical protein
MVSRAEEEKERGVEEARLSCGAQREDQPADAGRSGLLAGSPCLASQTLEAHGLDGALAIVAEQRGGGVG